MSKAIKKLKELFDQQDNEERDEEFNVNEGQNIVIKGKKDLIKKNMNNLEALQKDLKKYKGRDISYQKLREEQERVDQEDIEDENEDEEEIEDEDDRPKEDMDESEDKDQDVDDEEQEENYDEYKHSDVNKNKKQKQTKESMDKQDEDYLKTLTQFTPNEIKKAKNVENQKNTCDFFIGIRISLQKLLNAVNTLPFYLTLPKFTTGDISKTYNHSILSIQKLQQNLLTLHKKILLKSNVQSSNELSSLISAIPSNSPNESASHLISYHSDLGALVEKITNIWYRKSLVNSFKANNKILKILNDDFCQHIKSNVTSNYDSIRKKTQRITGDTLLGRKREHQAEDYDKEIYNDLEFYNFLLKEFLINNEKDLAKDTTDNGNRYDLTMQYILNRNKKNKRNVDTKASKNRKIRYNKHEQLINFMVPQVNYSEVNGRDIIVGSLFGTKKRKTKEFTEENEVIDEEISII